MVDAFQGGFGVNVDKAGVIDQGEQYVAKFFFTFGLGHVFFQGFFKLLDFFLYFVPNLLGVVPFKTHLFGLFLHTVGFDHGGQGFGDAREDRFFAFLELELFPVPFDLFFVFDLYITVDMRVAFDEFVTNGVEGIGDVEAILLVGNFGIKNQVQHQITNFLLDAWNVFFQNGVGQLISLFNGEVAEALEGLFSIPWTLLAQFVHDGEQAGKGIEFVLHGVLFMK